MQRQGEELLILAPAVAEDRVYRYHVRGFLSEGVAFPYGADDALPQALPERLEGLKCVMLDPDRRPEFETGPAAVALLEFQRRGGLVLWADKALPAGGAVGDHVVRHLVLRAIHVAGLTTQDPRLAARLHARDEDRLVQAWLAAGPEELAQYVQMGIPFCDPPGYHTFRAMAEAAEFFDRPELAEPLWEHISTWCGRGPVHFDTCGSRQVLELYRRTGERRFLDQVAGSYVPTRLWRWHGVHLNVDLVAPEGCDVDDPPPAVIERAWVWPETTMHVGDTYGALAAVTGDLSWAERAVTHIRAAHQWLFNPAARLWWHVGRPNGPDLRSAPWGRGNAWFLYALRGVLDALPAGHPAVAELSGMMAAGLEGLLAAQQPSGLWLNVLDAAPSDSREETSGALFYISALARAYHRGWLRDERIPALCERAWLGLKTRIWHEVLYDTCVGTGPNLMRQSYLARPQDTWRVSRSALLLAWMELQRMRACSAKVS